MHMISKKDLNSAELESVTTSRSPTTVFAADGEVQTNEEATVYVRELDIFLTMKLFEDTPAVLSLKKLCDEHGYSFEWINGQKPHLIKKGVRIQCNTENFVPIVVPGLSTSCSSGSYQSTSRTPSRQESHCSTSSSGSSSSPTATSNDNETREREDRTESDISNQRVLPQACLLQHLGIHHNDSDSNLRLLDCFVSSPLGLGFVSASLRDRHPTLLMTAAWQINCLLHQPGRRDLFVCAHVGPFIIATVSSKIGSGICTSTICSSIHSGVSFV